jgi:hypothetical protein
MTQNKHDDTDDAGREIVHYVSAKLTDLGFWYSLTDRSERRRKITHRVGFVSWDTWELEGSAIVFSVVDSLDDGTLNGPWFPSPPDTATVGEGFREHSSSSYAPDHRIVGKKAFYFFQGQEFSVEAGTNWEPESIQTGGDSVTESPLEEETNSEADSSSDQIWAYILLVASLVILAAGAYWVIWVR